MGWAACNISSRVVTIMSLTSSVVDTVIKSVRYVLRRGVKDDPEANPRDDDSASLSSQRTIGQDSLDQKSLTTIEEQTIFVVPTNHSHNLKGFCDIPDELLHADTKCTRRRQSSNGSRNWIITQEPEEMVTPSQR